MLAARARTPPVITGPQQSHDHQGFVPLGAATHHQHHLPVALRVRWVIARWQRARYDRPNDGARQDVPTGSDQAPTGALRLSMSAEEVVMTHRSGPTVVTTLEEATDPAPSAVEGASSFDPAAAFLAGELLSRAEAQARG